MNGSEEERSHAPVHSVASRPACPDLPDVPSLEEDPAMARAARILTNLGFCGHYMHFHRGGRSGRAPILCLLEKNGGTMSQQALGASSTSRRILLNPLQNEGGGLITRTRDRQDRRQLTVCLTEAGAEAAAWRPRRESALEPVRFQISPQKNKTSWPTCSTA